MVMILTKGGMMVNLKKSIELHTGKPRKTIAVMTSIEWKFLAAEFPGKTVKEAVATLTEG